MTSLATPFMGLFGGGEKAPEVSMYYKKQKEKDLEAAKQAAEREAEALRKRRGYRSTIITGPQGVLEPPTTRKTLLGE